jgi:5-methylthioadenosine/S-adenosylhomocysteine deaminase
MTVLPRVGSVLARCVVAGVLAGLPAAAASTPPFKRGVLLKGTVVTMDRHDRVLRHGNVLVRGDRVVAVWRDRHRPRNLRLGKAVVVAPRAALIFPGLINLHDHPTFSMLPPWPAPASDAQPAFGRPTGREPYANRYQWTGANGFADTSDEHHRLIRAPEDVLIPPTGLGLTSESVKWAEIRALLGGETADQGADGDPATDNLLARNVDGVNFGRDRVESETFPGPDAPLVARMRAGQIDAFIAHAGEGVRDAERRPGDSYSSRGELRDLQHAGLLSDETVIVHGTAFERRDFARMRHARSPRDDRRGDGLGAKLVWSPLSNLVLYGRTASVYEALAEDVTVSLGTDWSPSGSGNLLEELKIADIALRDPVLLGGSRSLVPALRSDRALDRALVAMVTRNPARTLRWGRRVGSIAPGRVADLVMIEGSARSPYRSLIDATERDVRLTLVGGDPLAGDAAEMRALKRGDYETIHSAAGGFTKAIDVTRRRIPKGSQRLAAIESNLRAALTALGGADGYAYLKARVGGGAFANATDAEFRSSYLEPTLGLRPDGTLNAEAIQLSPLLPADDDFRLRLIEGDRDGSGAIADATPPFAPYPVNANQIPPGAGNPFGDFEQRWYALP